MCVAAKEVDVRKNFYLEGVAALKQFTWRNCGFLIVGGFKDSARCSHSWSIIDDGLLLGGGWMTSFIEPLS